MKNLLLKTFAVLAAFAMVLSFGKVDVLAAAGPEPVKYIDVNGQEQTRSEYKEITSTTTSWDEWCIVKSDITINGTAICNGNVKLILADGATLNVKEGIRVCGTSNSLTIYCQKNGTGTLIATGKDNKQAGIGGYESNTGGNITINGGNIYATGGSMTAGIGGSCGASNITINGGNINATGGDYAAGIGGGGAGVTNASNITINDGIVTATGGDGGTGIGGGYGGSINQLRINNGKIIATGGTGTDAIGNGLESSSNSSNIFISASVEVKAGSSASPSGEVSHTSAQDLASSFAGKRYAVLKGSYTVSFDMQEHGEDVEPQTVHVDSKVEKPDNPSATGYTFDGWFKEAACENEWNFNTDTVEGTTELFAGWTAKTTSITFDANQGDLGSTTSTTGTYDSAMTTIASTNLPTRAGYSFSGFFDAASGGKKYYNADGTSANNWDKDSATATLYAQWEEPTYTVTYENNGHGTAPNQETVISGNKATEPLKPSETGYNFVGWYKEDTLTNKWNFGTDSVTKDITLYAHWVKIESTITTEGTGASVNQEDIQKILEKYAGAANSVKVKLDIVKDTVDATDKALIQAQATGKTLACYDVSLKFVEQNDEYDYGSYNTQLIKISYDLNLSACNGVQVFRVHGGTVSELKTTANADGEYIELDTTNNKVNVYAKKYSTYAIAYSQVGPTPPPTGDFNMTWVFGLLAFVALAAVVALRVKKNF